MKRKSRELSIFSMSALDLFASALGAFILIAVVMFPYFPNTGTADQRDLEAALERLQQEEQDNEAMQEVLSEIRQDLERRLEAVRAAAQREVDAARREADAARREAAGMQQELSEAQEAMAEGGDRERALETALERERRRKFLLVTISWDGDDDVDLHIVDPLGNEFYYECANPFRQRGEIRGRHDQGSGQRSLVTSAGHVRGIPDLLSPVPPARQQCGRSRVRSCIRSTGTSCSRGR